ncbi:MAG: TetR/AcrR family transcriptional regulator [Thermoleophilia bacterium]
MPVSESGKSSAGRESDERRPRGRPKTRLDRSEGSYPGLPLENPVASLPPTAVSILAAARRLLVERGIDGLTIEAVANEANVSRGLIPYHFGSRAGLIEMLVDSLFHDLFVAVAGRKPADSWQLEDLMQLMRDETADRRAFRDFFELLPYTLRHEDLRVRVAGLYDFYRELMLELAGITAARQSSGRPSLPASSAAGRPESLAAGAADSPQLQALGAVLLAIIDGLGLQATLNPQFDLEAALRAAEWLIEGRWAQLVGRETPGEDSTASMPPGQRTP